jgi:glucokinase
VAYLLHDGQRYRAFPSEGGHADFAPRGDRQLRLHAFLASSLAHQGQVHLEAACSGKGIANLWRFFAEEGLRDASATEAAIQAAADPTPLIMAAADDPVAHPRAAAAADEFIAILMQEAGNCGLRWLATGGVYLAGGVPPKVLPRLRRPAALSGFLSNPLLGRVLIGIPLQVVTNERAAVLGAIVGGRELLA